MPGFDPGLKRECLTMFTDTYNGCLEKLITGAKRGFDVWISLGAAEVHDVLRNGGRLTLPWLRHSPKGHARQPAVHVGRVWSTLQDTLVSLSTPIDDLNVEGLSHQLCTAFRINPTSA